jgi:hypothetical protein
MGIEPIKVWLIDLTIWTYKKTYKGLNKWWGSLTRI